MPDEETDKKAPTKPKPKPKTANVPAAAHVTAVAVIVSSLSIVHRGVCDGFDHATGASKEEWDQCEGEDHYRMVGDEKRFVPGKVPYDFNPGASVEVSCPVNVVAFKGMAANNPETWSVA